MVGLAPASHWPELPIPEARVALIELLDDGRVMLWWSRRDTGDRRKQDGSSMTMRHGLWRLITVCAITDEGVDLMESPAAAVLAWRAVIELGASSRLDTSEAIPARWRKRQRFPRSRAIRLGRSRGLRPRGQHPPDHEHSDRDHGHCDDKRSTRDSEGPPLRERHPRRLDIRLHRRSCTRFRWITAWLGDT